MKVEGVGEVKFFHGVDEKARRLTRCQVVMESGETLTGDAACSTLDNFCRYTGRKLSLGRALSGLGREQRAKVWATYWDNYKKR